MTIRPRRWRTILGAALVSALGSPAMAQSFDCAQASHADEKAICADGQLSALDDEMAALYRDIESHALMGVRGDTRDSQRSFLARRQACGADAHCIAGLYHARIEQLDATKRAVGQGAAD